MCAVTEDALPAATPTGCSRRAAGVHGNAVKVTEDALQEASGHGLRLVGCSQGGSCYGAGTTGGGAEPISSDPSPLQVGSRASSACQTLCSCGPLPLSRVPLGERRDGGRRPYARGLGRPSLSLGEVWALPGNARGGGERAPPLVDCFSFAGGFPRGGATRFWPLATCLCPHPRRRLEQLADQVPQGRGG